MTSFSFSNATPTETETETEARDLVAQVHRRFVAETDVAAMSRLPRAALAAPVRDLLMTQLAEGGQALTGRQRDAVVAAVVSEIAGLGPLDALLADPDITEIMVNSPRQVYVERAGRLARAAVTFDDDAHVRRILERMVAPLGRRIDDAAPLVDGRLPSGARFNAIIPPLAVRGPAITIRKFAPVPYVMEDLLRFGTLTPTMAAFLKACVAARLSILVSGGTGSGKTTLLNVLSGFIPAEERIVTIEDAAELQLQQEHVVALESRPANLEGQGEITIRQLVRNALRMRPDRIVIGEVRGAESLDLLQALNTGHDGALSTLHANSPRDALARLETLALLAGTELPLRAVREQIGSALHVIVHQARRRDGRRLVTQITEVQGASGEVIALQEIFRMDTADDAAVWTGLRPRVLDKMEERGVALPELRGTP